MATYQFLTDEWIEEARKIREEAETEGTGLAVPHPVKMNLVITEVPFGTGSLDAHVDTSSGLAEIDSGHVNPCDMTVTVDYPTARSILVDGNTQAAMQAFMTGRIKVDGDMSKLLELQSSAPGPAGAALAQKLREITE
ncbi:MAG: SCP2 sterol-binding domain-containing protein [Acidimicrobiales bacterium]|jgi:putative sterol carrier protein